MVELPTGIPLTSHVMEAPVARQNDAVKPCVCARGTVAAGGEMVFVAEHVIVTLAVADFDGSATLVTMTLTVEGDGGTAGATYSAPAAPLGVIVPRIELPPTMPFTLQVTAFEDAPPPVKLAVNACPAPVETVAEVGEIPITIPPVSVTMADPVALLSVMLDAVTVMVGGEGIALGAVYKPIGETVPTLAFPPATPFANHVTLLFDVPVTVAWNCCDWLRETLAYVGCKITVTTDGPVDVVPAQPGIATAAMQKIASKSRFGGRFDRSNVVAARLRVVFGHRRLIEGIICAMAYARDVPSRSIANWETFPWRSGGSFTE